MYPVLPPPDDPAVKPLHLLPIALCACATPQPRSLYVAPSAGDEWDDPAAVRAEIPFTTIQDAVDAATAGDTVLVPSGTYYETVYVADGVALQGAGREETILVGRVLFEAVSGASLSRMTIEGAGGHRHRRCLRQLARQRVQRWLLAGRGGLLPPLGHTLIVDPDYAFHYPLPAGLTLLTTGDATLGNGLHNSNDEVYLLASDGSTVIDSYTSPFDPGNGISVEKVDYAAGDTATNWVAADTACAGGDSLGRLNGPAAAPAAACSSTRSWPTPWTRTPASSSSSTTPASTTSTWPGWCSPTAIRTTPSRPVAQAPPCCRRAAGPSSSIPSTRASTPCPRARWWSRSPTPRSATAWRSPTPSPSTRPTASTSSTPAPTPPTPATASAGSADMDLFGFVLWDGDDADTLQGLSDPLDTTLPAGGYALILDQDYASDYPGIPAATLLLCPDDDALGSGLATNDPVYLYEANAVSFIDGYSFPDNPGDGISMEKLDIAAGDMATNWAASTCAAGSSPGEAACP